MLCVPSKSLGLLYDQRDDSAQITKIVVIKSNTFGDLVEMEKSSLGQRSRKLFTLSAIHYANNALLNGLGLSDSEEAEDLSIRYWNELGKYIKEWCLVKNSKITSGDVRQDFVHCHAILLQAMGVLGNALLKLSKTEQKKRLMLLSKINWKRTNSKVWEGRAIIGGGIQKGNKNVTLSANYLKNQLGIELSPEEQRIEDAFKRGEHG